MTFKITVGFEIIVIDFYSIGDFKSHITVGRTLGEPLTFPIILHTTLFLDFYIYLKF
jgi:hypothetical protein